MKLGYIVLFILAGGIPLLSQTYQEILDDAFGDSKAGGTAIVVQEDDILFEGATGMAQVELGVQAQSEHVFRIGSITKQFTSVAILKLMEEGKLSLQDDITKYLPDYPTQGKSITIEHLLTHTSGIKSYTNLQNVMQEHIRGDKSPEEVIAFFKDEPMEFDPGTSYNYNNSGYFLLGAIIEEITGKSYADYLQEALFTPLRLDHTYYDLAYKIIPNRAAGYTVDEKGELIHAQYISMTLPYAAGSLMSNVRDLYQWNKAVFAGKVISKSSLQKAHTPYTLANGESTGYGYGWSIEKLLGQKSITHGGGIFGFLTNALYLPDEDLFVAVFSNCNCQDPTAASKRLAALALGKPIEYKSIPLNEEQKSEYIGVYSIEDSEDLRTVYVEDGKLLTRRNDNRAFEIQAYGKDQFFYPDSRSKLTFQRNDQGMIMSHTLHPIDGDPSTATLTDQEVSVTEYLLVDEHILEAYTGSYELAPNFILEITNASGQLMGQATGQPQLPLNAISESEFENQQVGAKVIFDTESKPSTYLVLKQGGQEIKANRVKK